MARVVYNPPPGWAAAPPGWTPPPEWQPAVGWPPIPAGWPLFVTVRSWPRRLVWLLLLVGLVTVYVAVMAALGRPLTVEALGLVVVVLVAGAASRLVADRRPTPVRRWPWRPEAAAVGYRGEVDHELGTALPWMRDEGRG